MPAHLSSTLPQPKVKNLGLGVGLRQPYFQQVLDQLPNIDWFEIISENFMQDQGWNRHMLLQIREHYPMVMHGVSLSIGSTDPLDSEYLSSLKCLAEQLEPEWVSDHLCWTGFQGVNSHDLLPLPLTEESLQHVSSRVIQVQDYLQRPLVLENPSTYLEFSESTLSEHDFLNQLVKQTGCQLLIDVNNVYVSARNHHFCPVDYLQQIDHTAVIQTHIAVHTDCGTHCIDTHDQPVRDEVWSLYAQLQRLTGGVSTLLEWDAGLPSLEDLLTELAKAKQASELPISMPNPEFSTRATSNGQEAISTPIEFLVADRC